MDGCIREAVVHADEKEERHSQQKYKTRLSPIRQIKKYLGN